MTASKRKNSPIANAASFSVDPLESRVLYNGALATIRVGDSNISLLSATTAHGAVVTQEWQAIGYTPQVQDLIRYSNNDIGSLISRGDPTHGFSTSLTIRFQGGGVSTDIREVLTFIPLTSPVNDGGKSAAILHVSFPDFTGSQNIDYSRLIENQYPGQWSPTEISELRSPYGITPMSNHGGALDCIVRSADKMLQQENGAVESNIRVAMTAKANGPIIGELAAVYDFSQRPVGQAELALRSGIFAETELRNQFAGGYISGTLARFNTNPTAAQKIKQVEAMAQRIGKDAIAVKAVFDLFKTLGSLGDDIGSVFG